MDSQECNVGIETKSRARRSALAASLLATTAIVLCSCVLQSQPAAAQVMTQGAAARTFNIPAQPLAGALNAFGRQSGLQVTLAAATTQGVNSRPVNGSFTPQQALARMLEGTGIPFRITSDRTAVVGASQAAGGSGSLPAGAISLDTIDVQGASSSDPGKTEGTGSYTTSVSSFGKNQTLKELPQTVSVITHQRIQEQGLTTADNALEYTPGITVQQDSTANSNFFSRGFQITNFQIDGNSPLLYNAQGYGYGLITSQLDLAIFDRVEVLRGSDALYGVSGEPGGAINLVRKKPTRQFQMNALVHGGSWSNYRGELDVGGPLTENGSVRGRFVGVYEDRKYFFDVANSKKYLLYGIIEADVTDSTMLTFGSDVTHQNSTHWRNGLPRFSNGVDLGLPRSTFFGTDDDRWDRKNNRQFVRIDQELGERWTLGIEASRAHSKVNQRDFLWWGAIDPVTFSGLTNFGGHGLTNIRNETQDTLDAVLKGSFQLLGREHKVTVGANISRYKNHIDSYGRTGGNIRIPNIFEFDPEDYRFNDPYFLTDNEETTITQKGFYGSFAARLADPLTLIVGGRLSWYRYGNVWNELDQSTGAVSYTELTKYEDNKVFTPYMGLVYDFSKQWSAYASFAETYKPQASYQKGPLPGTPLGPVTGRTYEVGVKGSLLNGRLNTSLALYHIKRNGQAMQDPSYPPTPGDLGSSCCYLGDGRIVSQGVDIEVSGEIVDGWRIAAGYTFNDNQNKADSGRYSTITPKHLFKVWTSYEFQGQFEGWKIGGGVSAQSSHYQKGTVATFNLATGKYDGPSVPFEFTEPGRAIVDLFVQYKIDKNWTVAFNVNNVFDKKYYQTITWANPNGGNWYGAPRNFLLSARYKC